MLEVEGCSSFSSTDFLLYFWPFFLDGGLDSFRGLDSLGVLLATGVGGVPVDASTSEEELLFSSNILKSWADTCLLLDRVADFFLAYTLRRGILP